MIRTSGVDRAATVIFAIGLLALCPAYLAAVRLPSFGLFHDDGIYLVTAQSMVEGRGYHITSLPSEPPQTKYPPVFPLVLAAIWKLSPDLPENLSALKLVPLVGTAVWLALSVRLLRALGLSASVRSLACFATAASTLVVYLSATLLSETLFAALCTGALLCLEVQGPLSLKRVAAAAALAALAALTRIVGVSLIVAGTAWLLLTRRQPKLAALFGGIAVACMVPWWIWLSAGDSSGYYGAANYSSWNVLAFGTAASFSERVNVVFRNLLWISTSGPAILGGHLNRLMAISAVALLAGGVWRVLPEKRVSLWFLVAYLGLVALWAWPPVRFVAVVLPLLIWLVFAAVSRLHIVASVALMAVLALSGLRSMQVTYQGIRAAQHTGVFAVEAATERWQDVEGVARWLRAHTEPDEIVIGNLDPVYYLLTGRKAVRAFEADPFRLFYSNPQGANPLGDSGVLLARIHRMGATVVVDSPDVLFSEGPWLKKQIAELENAGDLRVVATVGDFRVLRPRP